MARFAELSAEKIERLHVVARAAMEGMLDRAHLRAMPIEQALDALRALHGIGSFSAQGTLLRGAGLADGVPDDDATKQAVQRAYALARKPDHAGVLEIAENRRPYPHVGDCRSARLVPAGGRWTRASPSRWAHRQAQALNLCHIYDRA